MQMAAIRLGFGLGSPRMGGMPGGLNMTELAELNVAGMNAFNMNMHGMANLNVTGIHYQRCNSSRRRAQLLLEAGQPGLAGIGGIGGFVGLQSGIGAGCWARQSRSVRRPSPSANDKSRPSFRIHGTAARRKMEKTSTRQC